MKKKTAKEWFRQLPEPYRTQAMENWGKSDWEEKNDEFDSLADAIECSFSWCLTQQEHEYWDDIHERARAGEFDINQYGWIPVSKRLPEESDADEFGLILIVGVGDVKLMAKPSFVHKDPDAIKFWQPIPKLPETI